MLLAKLAAAVLAFGLAVWLVTGTLDQLTTGKAIVLDGDTLEFDGGLVHLQGIDAPEFEQSCDTNGKQWACGAFAMAALLKLVHGRSVWCFEKGRDSDDAVLGQCYVGLSDLASEVVEQGWAVAMPDVARRYEHEEQMAMQTRRGIWRAKFAIPAEWRAHAEKR